MLFINFRQRGLQSILRGRTRRKRKQVQYAFVIKLKQPALLQVI